jgi:UDP-2-acetamido-2-deoxy-ribo-hexuluronate aminotransferase
MTEWPRAFSLSIPIPIPIATRPRLHSADVWMALYRLFMKRRSKRTTTANWQQKNGKSAIVQSTDKHLVLDSSAILDLWLDKDIATNATGKLLDMTRGSAIRIWISASTLNTLDCIAVSRFKQAGIPAVDARLIVKRLIAALFEQVEILTCYGFEQKDLYHAASDFEDAQIVASARCLHGCQVRIVSVDQSFDALGEIQVLTPAEAIDWIESPVEPVITAAIPFVNLPLQQTLIRSRLERNLETVLRHGQYILGPEVRELETRLAAYTGAKHCITVASGTEALLISLMALGIGPGDEVITTPFTFVATVEVIALLGATPVFVDIEPDTCNIDARLIETKITDKTKAIMPVSLYGQPADMDAINAIAARHDQIPVIEDAAQSFGATYKGNKSCNLSTIGCTSFFPSKPLGCYGDGGAIFTSDDALAQACREIRVHGQSQRYVHTRVGVGGRMDTLQCAVVLAKLDRFQHEVVQRQAVAWRYHELLSARQQRVATATPVTQQIRLLPWPAEERTSVFAQYTLLVDDRPAIQDKLKAAGIPTAVHYPVALNQQPAYAHLCCPHCTPIAQRLADQVVSLPMHADLAAQDQMRIIDALLTADA